MTDPMAHESEYPVSRPTCPSLTKLIPVTTSFLVYLWTSSDTAPSSM